uniref:Ferredoxin--NADP reductase, chloroplastic (Fragments) n=1 Tax=Imperata cylindrica TaxID=80369 RepID=FENR_IMPCY|nr:RecName: Full=Ferredoxin--NADP reductase, chloroplastic; Short=FNR [Imperata cylindrica]
LYSIASSAIGDFGFGDSKLDFAVSRGIDDIMVDLAAK